MPIDYPLPLVGFAAFSGTGKTTLLLKLLPLLKASGQRIAVVKHAHHSFDMDYPGKDSYRLRAAGADEIAVFEAAYRNDLPVLLSSGYGREKVGHVLATDEHCSFIQKPYRRRELLASTKDLLGEPDAT